MPSDAIGLDIAILLQAFHALRLLVAGCPVTDAR